MGRTLGPWLGTCLAEERGVYAASPFSRRARQSIPWLPQMRAVKRRERRAPPLRACLRNRVHCRSRREENPIRKQQRHGANELYDFRECLQDGAVQSGRGQPRSKTLRRLDALHDNAPASWRVRLSSAAFGCLPVDASVHWQAQISQGFAMSQRLLTSVTTILKHAPNRGRPTLRSGTTTALR